VPVSSYSFKWAKAKDAGISAPAALLAGRGGRWCCCGSDERCLIQSSSLGQKITNSIARCSAGHLWTMVFIVKSKAENFKHREFIRRTWGAVGYIEGGRLITIFCVGQSNNDATNNLLLEEKERYHDLLHYAGPDDYTWVFFFRSFRVKAIWIGWSGKLLDLLCVQRTWKGCGRFTWLMILFLPLNIIQEQI